MFSLLIETPHSVMMIPTIPFLSWLLAASALPDFMPHGYCYLWDPWVLWLHVISDGLITLSYYCIPIILIYFIRRNRSLPFNRVFWMFGIFILACGTTHAMEIWNIWHASYLVAGVVKAITASVSLLTAAMLIPLVPKVISLPGRMQSQEREIEKRTRAEAALQESLAVSERAFKDLADQKFALDQHAIVAVTDVQGTIKYVNEKFCAISQYHRDELLGRNHRILNSGYHRREFFQRMYRTIAGGKVWHGEIKNRAKDGSMYWVDTTIVPFVNADGKPRQYVAIRADITERKRAEEQLAELARELSQRAEELAYSRAALEEQTVMFKLVLESMGEGLIAADREGHFLLWNDAASKLMGQGAADLPTEQWTPHYKVFLPDGITPYPPDRLPLVRALQGESVQVELIVQPPEANGSTTMEVTARPMRDPRGILCGGVAVLRDITQRKGDELKIRKLYDQLEQRVLERTTQLQAANQELEAFTYSVSHDLRAPLRHIAGFTSLLLEESSSQLDPQALHHLHRIRDGTGKMGRLIDELLSLARIGRQSTNLRVVELGPMIEEVRALLRPDWKGRSVEWKVGPLPLVVCDPTLMTQVFQNLLSNALKYSHPREHPVIEVAATRVNNETVIFVRDNGVGFNMKYSDKLFGVFQRLHGAEDFEGTGVGLAIVDRIVKKHGGRIWAEAEPDKGATFYFTVSTPSADLKSIAATSGPGACV